METQIIESPRKKNKHHYFLLIFLVFIGILFFIIYTSFYSSDISLLTGRVIGNSGEIVNIEIDSTLTTPDDLNIKGEIEKVELRIDRGNFFIGKEKFDLSSSSIIIENYDGEIAFNKKNLTKFEGKSDRVFIDGLPISGKSELKISFENAYFDSIKLNNFFLNSLTYTASGIVMLNNEKAIINLDNENIKIEGFYGNLEVRGESLKLKGKIRKSNLGFINVKSSNNINNSG